MVLADESSDPNGSPAWRLAVDDGELEQPNDVAAVVVEKPEEVAPEVEEPEEAVLEVVEEPEGAGLGDAVEVEQAGEAALEVEVGCSISRMMLVGSSILQITSCCGPQS